MFDKSHSGSVYFWSKRRVERKGYNHSKNDYCKGSTPEATIPLARSRSGAFCRRWRITPISPSSFGRIGFSLFSKFIAFRFSNYILHGTFVATLSRSRNTISFAHPSANALPPSQLTCVPQRGALLLKTSIIWRRVCIQLNAICACRPAAIVPSFETHLATGALATQLSVFTSTFMVPMLYGAP